MRVTQRLESSTRERCHMVFRYENIFFLHRLNVGSCEPGTFLDDLISIMSLILNPVTNHGWYTVL